MPLNFGDFQELLIVLIFQYLYAVMGANTKGHAVACILTHAFCVFGTLPRLYKEELTAGTIYFKLMNLVCLAIAITIFSAITTYIARIEGTLKRLMLQNLGLLDGMYEGIIVLSGDEKSLEFAN